MSTEEIYKRFRPKTLKEVVGHEATVKLLGNFIKNKNLPHAIMFSGSSGIGKTTLARILAETYSDDMGIQEVNCAVVEAMQTVRDIQRTVGSRSMVSGKPRFWIMDEFQSFSRSPGAQQACLKIFEETHKYAYFAICTTEPGKISAAIRNRCTQIVLKPLNDPQMFDLLHSVVESEKSGKVEEKVSDKIIEVSQGSPRRALVLLEAILNITGERERLNLIEREELPTQIIEVARALIKPNCHWREIAKLLKNLEQDDPEAVRLTIIGYCKSVMLNNYKEASFCAAVIDNLFDSTYTSGSGFPGLCAMIYKCCKP